MGQTKDTNFTLVNKNESHFMYPKYYHHFALVQCIQQRVTFKIMTIHGFGIKFLETVLECRLT